LRAKRIRGILKKIGIGRFIYRDVDQHILQYETQKALLIKNVESCVRETLLSQRQQLKTLEAYHEFLSKEHEDKLLNLFGTFEADLEYLKPLNFLDSELISSSLVEIAQSRQFVVGYNEKLERTILKQKTMKLKETFLQAERDFTSLYNRQQYFSKRELKSWNEQWRNLVSIAEQCKVKGVTEIDFQDSLDLVVSVHNDGERLLNERNKGYVEKEILKSELFEKIDGHVLTEEQKRAIVVDETNNLVVAGAGTGKSTTLVGKAFYIVSKGLAAPENVLLIAFNKSVAKENEKKVNNIKPGITFTVKTFHSLGRGIIGKSKKDMPTLSPLAKDELASKSKILELLRNRMKEENFAKLINDYFLWNFQTYRSIFEFNSLGEYYQYLRDNGTRALQGHRVESLEECEIANFLYVNGVDYIYEHPYKEKTSDAEHGQYKPDFTLPELGIYIEHFGIDENGGTAPWVPREKYIADMNWKVALHEKNETTLIKTFTYERQAGNLLKKLETELLGKGVVFAPLPSNQIFDKLNERGKINSLASLLSTFLNLFKSSGKSLETLKSETSPDDTRTKAFLDIFSVIYKDYEKCLWQNGEIDFNDMINKATNLIEQNKYVSPFQYVLVDEFQDISQSRYRFLKALLNQNNSKLFCVGDDWQSINRFAGSDISIMTHFEKYFGPSEIRLVQETHRFSDKLCDFSTRFILENSFQIRKQIISKKKDNKPAVTIVKEKTESALERIIHEINRDAQEKEKILILNRYEEIGKPSNIDELILNNPNLEIEYTTIHKSKGRTVHSVIVVGLKSGERGFPCQIENDPVLDLIKAKSENFPNAEERRLFYVAITRAQKHVYLVVDEPFNVSTFVTEIENNGYEINTTGQKLKRSINCAVCTTGIIVRNEMCGLYECSNSPYCSYVPRNCPKCREDHSEGGNGFLYKDNSKYLCSNDKCSFQAKPCPQCEDGYLIPRRDKYGRPFFGCVNYSAKGCRHTEEEFTP
jgi:DNA helicase-4